MSKKIVVGVLMVMIGMGLGCDRHTEVSARLSGNSLDQPRNVRPPCRPKPVLVFWGGNSGDDTIQCVIIGIEGGGS